MADFDIIRNQTLMFFLDHLMGKGQSRTLHDLSCQFGAKGFTKEMRQIAGGSQAGLRKFLLQFPSLFTIDGENVNLTPLTDDLNGSSIRDYTKETIEFFTEKLMSYGIAEVPLKSLFGHRSQASPEIRHVSGQNVREFREFLQSQSNVFVVRDDYVVLQSVLDQLEQEGHNELLKRMPEEISHDPYLMQQLVNELEENVYNLTEKYSNKISIELLYNAVKSKEKLPALWDDFVKVPTDLITFLHMNSRIFLVQGNMVSLTNERLTALKEKKSANIDSDKSSHCFAKSALTKEGQQKTTTRVSSANSTVNQRIRSQIIKIVSQGSADSIRNTNPSLEESTDTNDNQYDNIDLQAIKPRVIVKNIECETIVEDIFENCSAIAFNVEGINLGVNGEVTLIQISYSKEPDTSRTNVVVFDVFLNPNLIESGLKKLLESEKIIKIGHDVRVNSVSLYKSFGITLKNVFDTQVAHLILQQQTMGRPAYKPTKYISFFTLCNVYDGLNLNPKMKDRLHKLYKKDYKYWKNRPLNEEMLQFAVTEVYALYPFVYEKIRSQIRPEYGPLFKQLVYESVFAYINVDEIKQLKRQRKFELELTDLKLKLFNNDKKKIVLSNREIRLLRNIDLTDEIRNKIEGPLNVAKKLKRFENKKANGSSENNPDESKRYSSDESEESDDYGDERILDDYFEKQSMSLSSREYDNSGDYFLSATNESIPCCNCHCHSMLKNGIGKFTNATSSQKSTSEQSQQSSLTSELTKQPQSLSNHQENNQQLKNNKFYRQDPSNLCDTSTQTLSTGDIVITKIFFNDTNQSGQE